MSSATPLRLATRASRLALWQAHHVRDLLARAAPERKVEIVEVSTVGDRDRDSRLAEMGGQGVFTREVQAAVLDGRADIAVHSLKDLPTETAAGLALAGIPSRAPRWDVLIAPQGAPGNDVIPDGARVATGSLRRRAQLLYARPDLVMCEIRGNVETRIRKLDAGEYDMLILAEAGLERLGLADRITSRFQPPVMYPAVGQAALGLECRSGDPDTIELLGRISDPATRAEVLAERACLRALRAGCHAPVGTLALHQPCGGVSLEAVVLSTDGTERLHVRLDASVGDPEATGRQAAEQLFALGAERLLTHSR
jgi:hydroxymethylbilane synthase